MFDEDYKFRPESAKARLPSAKKVSGKLPLQRPQSA